jgi:CMP-N-acetylneuraminic acid synthetase
MQNSTTCIILFNLPGIIDKGFPLKNIAFIPSKGNSEGVPKKNLQKIGNHSLVEWSIELAVESNLFESIVVSTESSEVIENTPRLARFLVDFQRLNHGQVFEAPNKIQIHKRSVEHATRLASTLDLLENYLDSQSLESASSLTLLQPTCPFRSISELAGVLELVQNGKFHSVASARLFDSPHPQKAIRVSADSTIEANQVGFQMLSSPRQELDELYVLDGAYYCAEVAHFRKTKRLVSEGTHILKRKGVLTMNIDNEDDLHYARYVYETKKELIPWTPMK